jgi:hypothetical protein
MATSARALCAAFMTADMVREAPLRGPIEKFEITTLDGKTKGVLFVAGCAKGLVLNTTNTNVLVEAYGDEMENWIGKPIEVFKDRCQFKSKMVDCCRVRAVAG